MEGEKLDFDDDRTEGVKLEQQTLVLDSNGEISIESDHPREKERNYPPLRVERGKYLVDKKEENLFSFNKGIEIQAYSRGLRRYTNHILKNNINAYIVRQYKNKPNGEYRCYCFEENLDEQVHNAALYSRGYSEALDSYFPYFFAYKSQERKAKKSQRLINSL